MIIFIITLILSTLSYLYHGFALTCIWEWLILPSTASLIQLPVIGFKTAVAIMVLVSYLNMHRIRNDELKDPRTESIEEKILNWFRILSNMFIMPTMTILMSFIMKIILGF